MKHLACSQKDRVRIFFFFNLQTVNLKPLIRQKFSSWRIEYWVWKLLCGKNKQQHKKEKKCPPWIYSLISQLTLWLLLTFSRMPPKLLLKSSANPNLLVLLSFKTHKTYFYIYALHIFCSLRGENACAVMTTSCLIIFLCKVDIFIFWFSPFSVLLYVVCL